MSRSVRSKLPKSFSPSPGKLDPLVRQAMALGARMVLDWERTSRRVSVLGMSDDAIGDLFGWPSETICLLTPGNSGTLRRLLRQRHAELSRGPAPRRFDANLEILARQLGLSQTDTAILRVAALMALHNVPHEIASHIRCGASKQFIEFLALVTGATASQVQESLRDDALLLTTGLLDAENLDVRHHDFESRLCLLDGLASQLAEGDFGASGVKTRHVQAMPSAKLELAQYPHIREEAALVRKLLEAALAKRAVGINILLHGAPGTGKTELARALVTAVGGAGSEIKTDDIDKEGGDGRSRLRKFAFTQRLLKESKGQVILFDEVEDVLASDGDWGLFMFGSGHGLNSRKGWKISQLEANPVPTIWTCNSIRRIDPALQRRFTYCLEVPVPPRSVRLGMLKDVRDAGSDHDQLLEKIAESDRLTPADVERVNRVLALCPPATPADWRKQVLLTLGGRPDGVDTSMLLSRRMSCDIRYEPRWINATPGVADVAARLGNAGEGRLCFAGPPGTGKTAFAKHLARQLDRPLISKKASDLLSPWLGETEANLAGAFREARRDGAVLLIDEADSFLQDRRAATRSWEITQVNEVLKHLEEHAGYVILSTNLYDHLDQAVLRRLDVKVMFGYLASRDLPEVFYAAAEGMAISSDEVSGFCAGADWSSLTDLAMGDVAVAMRQVRLTAEAPTPKGLFAALREQLAHRHHLQGRRIGF